MRVFADFVMQPMPGTERRCMEYSSLKAVREAFRAILEGDDPMWPSMSYEDAHVWIYPNDDYDSEPMRLLVRGSRGGVQTQYV